MQSKGGAAEMQFFCNRDEIAEMPDLDLIHIMNHINRNKQDIGRMASWAAYISLWQSILKRFP